MIGRKFIIWVVVATLSVVVAVAVVRIDSRSPIDDEAQRPRPEQQNGPQVSELIVPPGGSYIPSANDFVSRNIESTSLFFPTYSARALFEQADVVAVITVLRKLEPDYYPAAGATYPRAVSRFEVRMEDVLKGDVKAGSTLTLHVEGGRWSQRGSPAMAVSVQPQEGEVGVPTYFAEYPMPGIGVRQLIFGIVGARTDDGSAFVETAVEGRYELWDGDILQSTLTTTAIPLGADGVDPFPARRDLNGMTLGEVRADAERWVAAGPNPGGIEGAGLLDGHTVDTPAGREGLGGMRID